MENKQTDLLIIGAGPVGLSLALAVVARGFSVILIDKKKLEISQDQRTLAISYANQQFLQSLNAWSINNLSLGQINHIHISQQFGDADVEIDHEDLKIPALGYTISYAELWQNLFNQARTFAEKTSGLTIFEQCQFDYELTNHEKSNNNFIKVIKLSTPTDSLEVFAKLIVHAEGSTNSTNQSEYWQLPYQQIASVFQLEIEPKQINCQANYNWAWERFTPSGPLAILPGNNCFHAVMINNLADIDEKFHNLTREKNYEYSAEKVEEYFTEQQIIQQLTVKLAKANEQIEIKSVGVATHFPLRLSLKKEIVIANEIWLGNAAQTLHPVSGQGLNLGLRDVNLLSELLLSDARHLDYLSIKRCLNKYKQKRQIDRFAGALFTDNIVRIFSNSSSLMSYSRDVALKLLANQPPIKNFIARRMIWGNNSL